MKLKQVYRRAMIWQHLFDLDVEKEGYYTCNEIAAALGLTPKEVAGHLHVLASQIKLHIRKKTPNSKAVYQVRSFEDQPIILPPPLFQFMARRKARIQGISFERKLTKREKLELELIHGIAAEMTEQISAPLKKRPRRRP